MFLCDYHVHSDISPDSRASMHQMVHASAQQGISQMCFTNHCDLVDWSTMKKVEGRPDAPERSVLKYRKMLEEFGAPPIDVRIGLELGEAQHDPEMARSLAKSEGMDFIMGSLHVLTGHGDFCMIDYKSAAQCYELYDKYMDEMLEIARLDFFDVMAHVGYCRRYMSRCGFDIALSMERYGDKICELFKIIIANGRGIEINCSGIRDGIEAYPNAPLLRVYRDLGGEILTIGSDAHRPEDAAKCVRDGFALAKDCGFSYISTFKSRKAEFVKI